MNNGYQMHGRRPSVRKAVRPNLKVLIDEPARTTSNRYERRFYSHRDPVPLHAGGTGKLVAYACGRCGSVKSLKHQRAALSLAAAKECCRHQHACLSCGVTMPNGGGKCGTCWSRDNWHSDRNRARKARIVPDDGGPVWCHWSSGSWGDGYSACLADHLEHWGEEKGPAVVWVPPPDDLVLRIVAGADRYGTFAPADPSATTPPPPPFVFCTTSITPEINLESIHESLADEMHEDFDANDLPMADELAKAVEAFNEAQKPASFFTDYTRVVVIDQARFDEYLATDWDDLPDIKWNPRRSAADPVAARQPAEAVLP